MLVHGVVEGDAEGHGEGLEGGGAGRGNIGNITATQTHLYSMVIKAYILY